MKKLLVIIMMIPITVSLFAQNKSSIIIFGGFGQSFFSSEIADEIEEAKYVPVGAQFFLETKNFSVGGEINYSVVPFTFSANSNGSDIAELTITQLYYGGVVKFSLPISASFKPYIRAGSGIYTGKFKIDWSDEITNSYGYKDSETDYKSAFGYNLGGGFELGISSTTGIIIEFVYHKVDRKLDTEEATASKSDNAAIHAGFKFGL